MTFDLFFRLTMGVIAAIHAIVVIRALRSGRWPQPERTYFRAEAPTAYWREIGLACLRILLAVAAFLIVPAPTESERYPPYGAALFFILIAPGLIRMIWTGEIEFGSNNRWGRRDPPYWVILLIGLAFVAFMGFALIRDLKAA